MKKKALEFVPRAITLEQRNDIARQWLKAHDLFNIAAITRRINYNRGAFGHFQEGHLDFTVDTLKRLEDTLAPYGYDVNENFGLTTK